MDVYKLQNKPRSNPFHRPWLQNDWAAAAPTGMGLKGLLVGGLIGAIESVFSYPIELAKTKQQLKDKASSVKQPRGVLNELKHTFKENGFFGLYRGLSVILIFSIPKIAVRFSSFEFFKSLAVDESGALSPLMRVGCGLGAGVSEAVFAVVPMETLKVKFIHDQNKKVPEYKGFFHGIRKIVEQHGIKGVYQGMVPTVIRQGSNQAIRFYVIETFKLMYRKGDPSVEIPTLVIGGFGVVAATASVLANTPVDVIKTKMQGLEAKKYKNTLDCAKHIWTNEGFRGFYKGTQARLIRVCIDVGFTFMIYERLITQINKIWP